MLLLGPQRHGDHHVQGHVVGGFAPVAQEGTHPAGHRREGDVVHGRVVAVPDVHHLLERHRDRPQHPGVPDAVAQR